MGVKRELLNPSEGFTVGVLNTNRGVSEATTIGPLLGITKEVTKSVEGSGYGRRLRQGVTSLTLRWT